MGYECKAYVVDVNHVGSLSWASVVATFDLCAIGYEHLNSYLDLFKKDVDYDLYLNYEKVTEDCYGKPLKSAKVGDIVAWLEEVMKEDNYRRFRPYLGLLKGFDSSEWENLEVIHFGY